MCQNPIQTIHQNKMMGLGRITRKRSTVTKMLSASASDRRSEQWEREAAVENLNERGKTVGKPMEVRPCAESGRKSVKFPIRLVVAQPPFESLI
jgi:hypothetical protein